jgi:hypothetical protein
MFESCAWESVVRGEICGAGTESAAVLGDVVCDVGEVDVVAAEEEAVENLGVGVPAVGEERSQWRIAPSEPPETRIGCTGCHARAVWFMGNVS